MLDRDRSFFPVYFLNQAGARAGFLGGGSRLSQRRALPAGLVLGMNGPGANGNNAIKKRVFMFAPCSSIEELSCQGLS